MKRFSIRVLFCILLSLAFSPAAKASEHEIGNGGGAWACWDGELRWMKLVDLYEGRGEFGLEIIEPGAHYSDIIRQIRGRLSALNQYVASGINRNLDSVLMQIMSVDGQLEYIDDVRYRVRPPADECLSGEIRYIQLANYTRYGKILLRQRYFESSALSETDRAALMLHEAVYAYLRERYNEQDSVRARRIVALLFSTLSVEDMKREVEYLLEGDLYSLGITFVTVPRGVFLMGSSPHEEGRYIDEDSHMVQMQREFEIQTTEITQHQYYEVMGSNPSFHNASAHCPTTHTVLNGISLCPDFPVENVSYDEVQFFLVKLNQMQQGSYFYRLPKEAEWEYAARAGNQSSYFFGNDPSLLPQFAWGLENSGNTTNPVGMLRPNILGLHDMYGNVSEWVQDPYGNYREHGEVDPEGSEKGFFRQIRGGFYGSEGRQLRSAAREPVLKSIRRPGLGFRLVRIRKAK